MSVVYKAKHTLMDRTVAIKMLNGTNDQPAIDRFQQEARAASSLSHRNIISIYEFGMENKTPYLVMDFLGGLTLQKLIDDVKRVDTSRAIPIFRQICEGLEHAHRKGIVHRDLKPSNICLTKQDGAETVKIVDFGIAKLLPAAGRNTLHLTQTGEVLGSPLYMSPEQCQGKLTDSRSDIYSMGCLMYECLTGIPPLMGETSFETMEKHIAGAPAEFAKTAPDLKVDKNLEAAIFRCLEKNPEDRYQNASELLGDLPMLDPTSGSMSVRVVQHPKRQKLEFKLFRNGFFVLLALLIGLFIYGASDNGTATDHGTVLEKTIFNSETTFAQTLMDNQMYPQAKVVLDAGEKIANDHFNNPARILIILTMKRELFKDMRLFEDMTATDKRINELQRHRTLDSYDRVMRELDTLSYDATSEDMADMNKILARTGFRRIRAVAAELAGNSMEEKEQLLLLRAKGVYTKVLGAKDPLLADVDIRLSDSYEEQQRREDRRRVLQEALQIYKQSGDTHRRDATIALLKLGQVDRDDDFFDVAKTELSDALSQTGKDFPNDSYLLYQCLNSNQVYCQQVHDNKGATAFALRAKALREQHENDW